MTWELQSDRPIYTQLVELIELKICSGVYPLGSKLPPVRDLAKEASVNPNTMQRALAKLEEDGLLYTNRTSGRYVTEDSQMIQHIKKRMAEGHTHYFINKMTELGFNNSEIISMLNRIIEREDSKNE